MPVYRNHFGTWRPIVDVWRNHLGTWQRVQKVYRNHFGTWQLVHQIAAAPSLAVAVSPAAFNQSYNSGGTTSFSAVFNATASGGAGGYSFAWSRIAQSGSACSSSIAGASLTLSASWSRNALRTYSETWRCTATDALGATAIFDVPLYVEVVNNS